MKLGRNLKSLMNKNMKQIAKSKRSALGEGILMIYRLFLVAFIAIVILGANAVFYDYYIDTKPAEAGLLGKQVYSCISENGGINLDKLNGKENSILDYCGIKGDNLYAHIEISFKDKTKKFEQGSGLAWIAGISKESLKGSMSKNIPGEFEMEFNAEVSELSVNYPAVVKINAKVMEVG